MEKPSQEKLHILRKKNPKSAQIKIKHPSNYNVVEAMTGKILSAHKHWRYAIKSYRDKKTSQKEVKIIDSIGRVCRISYPGFGLSPRVVGWVAVGTRDTEII